MSQVVSDFTNISRCGTQFRNRLLEPLGLGARQASLLLEICATPGISQDTLTRRVFLNKSVIARQLASLEEDGFVQRLPCQRDRRITRLHPTEKTLAILPQLQAIWDDWETYLTEGMDTADLEMLKRILQKLKARATQWMEGD